MALMQYCSLNASDDFNLLSALGQFYEECFIHYTAIKRSGGKMTALNDAYSYPDTTVKNWIFTNYSENSYLIYTKQQIIN